MCDTMVALGNATKDGSVLFAKNSDRQPNEPHLMIHVPRRQYQTSERLKATYIELPQAGETYEVLLLKPSWIWGAEMGANEHGLNIGNEAVFTREANGSAALTGMDMLRIALEGCRTSEEALELMIELLARYGQGGNCGYEKSFTYHNSFLIADRSSAWVLETAGKYWAAKEVVDVYAISNRLTIGEDYDRIHPEAAEHARKKGYCRKGRVFSFRDCYSNPLVTALSGSAERLGRSHDVLEREKGRITAETLKQVLRSHHAEAEGRQFSRHSLKSVCMHGGGIIGDHTTGSYIAALAAEHDGGTQASDTYRVTGASTPCLAAFKPLWLKAGMPVFGEDAENDATEYWLRRERLHRLVLAGKVDTEEYLKRRDELEAKTETQLDAIERGGDGTGERERAEISRRAFKEERELVEETLEKAERAGRQAETADYRRVKTPGGLYFRRYWKKRNRTLFGPDRVRTHD